MFDVKARRRVVIGRNIALTSGAVYAFTRGIYYATTNPADLSPAQDVLTADGRVMGLWAAVWFTAMVLCIADMINRHTRYGLSMVVALAFGWGVGYFFIWACTGFTDFSVLSSAIGWLTPAGLVFGFLIKVTALQDMIRTQPPGGEDDD
jgi:ribose/xylose/arabinose/galactoside ABC-type transport system permease subunit